MGETAEQLVGGGQLELEKESNDLTDSVLLQLSMLALALLLGYCIKHYKVPFLSEAGGALLLGVLAGCIVEFSETHHHFKEEVNFSEEVFFLFLLPPIIFESGYNMENTKTFFSNFGAICMLAFLGTAVSTLVVGLVVYLASVLGVIFPFDLLQTLLFGSLISATDPVTVLAVFQELKVQPNLYCLVFGESVLNDAVAIVLYRTLSAFTTEPVSLASLAAALGSFLAVFLGSVLIGTMWAMGASLLFKYTHFRTQHDLYYIETCLVVIFPYMSYTMAEAFELSGIVSILFCGIGMAHYMRPNLSVWSQAATRTIFKTLSVLAETFVFIYMGVAAFLSDQKWSVIPFAVVAIFGMVLGRFCNVYPNVYLINRWRKPSERIPSSYRTMLNISGLRGAIAFALALGSPAVVGAEAGHAMLTATLIIVLLTVLLIGGATPSLVDLYHLREGHEHLLLGAEEAGRVDSESREEQACTSCMVPSSEPSDREPMNRASSIMEKVEKLQETLNIEQLEEINSNYLKPIFHRTDIRHPVTMELADLRSPSRSNSLMNKKAHDGSLYQDTNPEDVDASGEPPAMTTSGPESHESVWALPPPPRVGASACES